MQARFEVGRTHLAPAELAQTQGNRAALSTHLTAAYAVFRTLRLPKYVERAQRLAGRFAVALSESAAVGAEPEHTSSHTSP